MTWSIGHSLPLSQVVGLCTIVGYLFWPEPKRLPRQSEVILLLTLWGMYSISTFLAIYPEQAFVHYQRISKILLMVFLSMSIINTEERLHLLMRVIFFSIGIYAVRSGIFSIVTNGQFMVYGPEDSFLEANNSIGLAFVMNVPFLFYFLKIEHSRWLRWLIKAMLVLSYPAVICTFSRGAWLGLAVVTVLIMLKSEHKFRTIAVASIFGILIAPLVPLLIPQRVAHRYDDLTNYEKEGSAQSRLWTWEFCRRVGVARPLVGGGFDFYSRETYELYYPEYLQLWSGDIHSCHSMWFTVLGEHGVITFFLWLGLLGSGFLSLKRIRAYGMAHREKSWVIHYADMLQVAFVGYIVVGTFLDVAYFDLFYQSVAVIAIIREKIRYMTTGELSTEPDLGMDRLYLDDKKPMVGGKRIRPPLPA